MIMIRKIVHLIDILILTKRKFNKLINLVNYCHKLIKKSVINQILQIDKRHNHMKNSKKYLENLN